MQNVPGSFALRRRKTCSLAQERTWVPVNMAVPAHLVRQLSLLGTVYASLLTLLVLRTRGPVPSGVLLAAAAREHVAH